MKREILFRGKLSHSGIWIQGNLIIAENQLPYIVPSECIEPDGHHLIFDDKSFWVDSQTVGQFTGFFDKNGAKIFEGDIVRTLIGSFYRVEDVVEFHLWMERQFSRSPELSISGNFHDLREPVNEAT